MIQHDNFSQSTPDHMQMKTLFIHWHRFYELCIIAAIFVEVIRISDVLSVLLLISIYENDTFCNEDECSVNYARINIRIYYNRYRFFKSANLIVTIIVDFNGCKQCNTLLFNLLRIITKWGFQIKSNNIFICLMS